MATRTFHTFTFNGVLFTGLLCGDGPYLSAQSKGGLRAGLALGSAASLVKQGDLWHIMKYRSQSHFELHGFSDADAQELAHEFGIALERKSGEQAFFNSPAFESLKEWVAKHPRIAKGYAGCQNYLPGWYAKAQPAVASSGASKSTRRKTDRDLIPQAPVTPTTAAIATGLHVFDVGAQFGEDPSFRFASTSDSAKPLAINELIAREEERNDLLDQAVRSVAGYQKAIAADPCNLDAYAHGMFFHLDRHEYGQALQCGLEAFNAATALIPVKRGAWLNYYELANRPYFRLAHHVALALHGLGRIDDALAVCRTMLALWPNDNKGFRHLLDDWSKKAA